MTDVPRALAVHEYGHMVCAITQGARKFGLRRDGTRLWTVLGDKTPAHFLERGQFEEAIVSFASGAVAEAVYSGKRYATIDDLIDNSVWGHHDLEVLDELATIKQFGIPRALVRYSIMRTGDLLKDVDFPDEVLSAFAVSMERTPVGETWWPLPGDALQPTVSDIEVRI